MHLRRSRDTTSCIHGDLHVFRVFKQCEQATVILRYLGDIAGALSTYVNEVTVVLSPGGAWYEVLAPKFLRNVAIAGRGVHHTEGGGHSTACWVWHSCSPRRSVITTYVSHGQNCVTLKRIVPFVPASSPFIARSRCAKKFALSWE